MKRSRGPLSTELSEPGSELATERLEEQYRRLTPRSRRVYEQTRKWIPGGTGGGLGFLRPYPTYIRRAEGCYLYDLDGRRLVDLVNGSYSLPLGHNLPEIRDAVTAQLQHGMFFTAPSELEHQLARLLCERIPSLEKVRFTASGTEATLFALRLARAITGRPKIAKMVGGYHGSHDSVEVGTGRSPVLRRDISPGLSRGIASQVVLLPFNHHQECEHRIMAHKDELAAVIVEPVLGSGGMIPPGDDFLTFLRDLTRRQGILLIFDEMISSPLATGGAQEYYRVVPDLTAAGKAMGGGMPMGVFGGRADIMALVDPAPRGRPLVGHIATYGGHPLSMASSIALLEALTPQVHRQLHKLGNQIREGLRKLASDLSVPLQVTGAGHLFAFHWTKHEVVDYETAKTSDFEVIRSITLSLLNRGFFISGRARCCISTALTEEHVKQFITAMRESLLECGLAKG